MVAYSKDIMLGRNDGHCLSETGLDFHCCILRDGDFDQSHHVDSDDLTPGRLQVLEPVSCEQ